MASVGNPGLFVVGSLPAGEEDVTETFSVECLALEKYNRRVSLAGQSASWFDVNAR